MNIQQEPEVRKVKIIQIIATLAQGNFIFRLSEEGKVYERNYKTGEWDLWEKDRTGETKEDVQANG